MAIAALEQILDWGVERIAATLAQRTAQIAARARELGLAPLPDAQRGPHMLGINLPETARSKTLEALADEQLLRRHPRRCHCGSLHTCTSPTATWRACSQVSQPRLLKAQPASEDSPQQELASRHGHHQPAGPRNGPGDARLGAVRRSGALGPPGHPRSRGWTPVCNDSPQAGLGRSARDCSTDRRSEFPSGCLRSTRLPASGPGRRGSARCGCGSSTASLHTWPALRPGCGCTVRCP